VVNRSELVMKPLDSSTHSELSERFSCCASRRHLSLNSDRFPESYPMALHTAWATGFLRISL
jgi:hypothetical protein